MENECPYCGESENYNPLLCESCDREICEACVVADGLCQSCFDIESEQSFWDDYDYEFESDDDAVED